MLQAQVSVAESMDGDELRSEDSFVEERPCIHYYALYLYQAGSLSHGAAESDDGSPVCTTRETPPAEGFSLSLVDTNLPAESEPELRSFMAKRLSRGALFVGMGNVVSVELSFAEDAVGCYYCLLRQEQACDPGSRPPEYVVCFLGGPEKGLDLFRLELDKHAERLKAILDPQAAHLDTRVSPHLAGWFAESVLPISRVVTLFQEKLAYLLHAALSSTPVEVKNSDVETENDIFRFLSSASLHGLVQDHGATSLCVTTTEELHKPVTVDCGGSQPRLIHAASNAFCEDWVQVFMNSAGGNPFLFRQKLENFKLKVIQDMNNLKRLLRQADTSHYALFRCYTFLKNCGNGDILLDVVRAEQAENPESSGVVSVLEEFIRDEGFGAQTALSRMNATSKISHFAWGEFTHVGSSSPSAGALCGSNPPPQIQ
ncbi:protein Njmu-R1 [Spea bombifrons]|uniref:protein Njmu-R1 n=1 Tax=Spea bombifrons TaxID=233779 RepID=UPI00234AB7AB|nr:protein Njmu-R1 [Spea bombifrons]